jgi:hypothetical protein
MNKLNKKTISKLVLIIFMVTMVTFLTSCTFSSSMLDSGVNEIVGGFKGLFDAIINGLVAVLIGIGEGLWTLIVGIFYLLVGALAWVWEFIVGLF